MSHSEELRMNQKIAELEILAQYHKALRKDPQLRFLFLELTLKCNENCIHCGSRCGEVASEELPVQVYYSVLEKIAKDFAGKLPALIITGGEPLLRKEFFEIVNYAKKLGFAWGMTSNGTLITKDVARKLKEAGMTTISVSLDGTQEYHDQFRRTPNAFMRAVEGIKNLLEQNFEEVQVTTVVTTKNLSNLEELFAFLVDLNVDSWRILGMEPIGRALDFPEYALSMEQQLQTLNYIKEKREAGYEVTYSCSHYLGLAYEKEVREWYYLCNAGVYAASIMANGDIGACLDIERRPETIQGNVLKDDFTDVWLNRFQIFRTPLSQKCKECQACPNEKYCEGGPYHSWDYDLNRPRICMIPDSPYHKKGAL